MEKYFEKLVKQFKSATGTKNVDVNSQEFIKEFSEWIKSRKIMGSEYWTFIEYMGVYPTIGESSVEIGKGKYDSIVLDKDIPMVTPYSEDIEEKVGGIIIADFSVYDGMPTIISYNNGRNQLEVFYTQYIRRFITQNPYEQCCINNWDQLHNSGENITVGIFGNIYDKDIELKIRQIEMLRDGFIDDSYNEEYITNDDRYYYAISSTRNVRKVKGLRKTLTR